METKGTVFVGISGGVDSSVAALRLKKQGYNVVGVFIRVWQPDFIECNWEAERLDAMRVAASLDIPFLMCDAQAAYKKYVADYFINEYRAGRTPNPDVLCNKAVKFGFFYDYAIRKGADFVSTGHYAQITQQNSEVLLQRGVDTSKDQSYFLWMIEQEKLRKVLLPVGDTTKDQIRKEAEGANIPVAQKKDSQGVCFLGHIDIPDFLSHFIKLEEGAVLDTIGNTIGVHRGAVVYTEGQRHGFTIDTTEIAQVPHYVQRRDLGKNTITVDSIPPQKSNEQITLSGLNLFTQHLKENTPIQIQTRYRQTPLKAQITSYTENNLSLNILEPFDTPASGQSCVLYNDDICFGGGIIE